MGKSEIKSTKEPETIKDPEEGIATIEPVLITLDSYCDGLDQTGIDKFAKTILQSRINAGLVTPQNKTREEWEGIYIYLKFKKTIDNV